MYIRKFQNALDQVLKIDPSLAKTAAEHTFPQFLETHVRPCTFQYIVQSIISQQLSGLAARAIQNKFIAHYGQFPSPQQVLDTDHDTLRGVGLSNQKVKYVHGVAEAYKSGELSDEILAAAEPDEIVDRLVALKGIGAWSAQMFLLFYHQHMDVFSPGDLGIQRGFKRYMKQPGAEEIKRTLTDEVEEELLRPQGTSRKALLKAPLPPECKHMMAVAAKFRPYRSAFQLLMWKLSDTIVEIGKRPKDEGSVAKAKPEVTAKDEGKAQGEGKTKVKPRPTVKSKPRPMAQAPLVNPEPVKVEMEQVDLQWVELHPVKHQPFQLQQLQQVNKPAETKAKRGRPPKVKPVSRKKPKGGV